MYLHGILSLQKAAKLLEKTEKINCQLILISQYERVLSGSVEQVPEAERFFNEDSDQGITASIKLGTEVAWDNADAYLYFVADQPCMAGETIARFVSEFMKSKKGIGCVCAKGHRGSPNIFRRRYKKELLALEGDQGGRQIMQKYPQEIWMMEVDERELKDIDQPADLTALRLELENT